MAFNSRLEIAIDLSETADRDTPTGGIPMRHARWVGQLLLNRRGAIKRSVGAASVAAMATGILPFGSMTVAVAQDGQEPLGGQPPKGAKTSIKDFDYQIKYQRAFEAVLWNMPAIAIYSFRRAAFTELGMKDNDIIAYSATATP